MAAVSRSVYYGNSVCCRSTAAGRSKADVRQRCGRLTTVGVVV